MPLVRLYWFFFFFLTSSFCQRVHFLFTFTSLPFLQGPSEITDTLEKKGEALLRSATNRFCYDQYCYKMVWQHFSSFLLNLNCRIPRSLGFWDVLSSHHLDLRHRRDLPRDFSLGSTSPLTNVLSSSSSLCLQSLLLYSVSLLISVRPRHPHALFAHSEDGRRAARLDTCGCKKNCTQPLGGHAGSLQPSFDRVADLLASYQSCALASPLSTRTLWITIILLAVVLIFT